MVVRLTPSEDEPLPQASTAHTSRAARVADRFPSVSEAKMEVFDDIEAFYNQRRRHSTLGQISPAEFERRAAA